MGMNGPGRYDIMRYGVVGICWFAEPMCSVLGSGQFSGLPLDVCSNKIVGRR